MHSSVFIEDMMSMFVDMYINLFRMVTMFCLDSVNDEFNEVTEEFENIFYQFIHYEEEHFG